MVDTAAGANLGAMAATSCYERQDGSGRPSSSLHDTLLRCGSLNDALAVHVARSPDGGSFAWVSRKGEDKRRLTWRQLDTAINGTAGKLRSQCGLAFGDTGWLKFKWMDW